jgi:hypothetical protein
MLVELAARFVFLRPVQRPLSLRRAMLQALHYSRTGFLLPPCPLANRPKVDDLAHAHQTLRSFKLTLCSCEMRR